MRVLRGDPASWDLGGRPHAVTIGVYDGVHRGHQAVLGRLRTEAAARSASVGLVTFDLHPLAVTAPRHAPRLLTAPDRKLELLEEAGVDAVGILPFGDGVRSMTPSQFAATVLVGAFTCCVVVVGEGFRFGKDRAGDTEILEYLGADMGFDVVVVPLEDGGGPLSSTRIRELLAGGEVAAAADTLGRPFDVRGRVVRGSGRGGRIGIPTANLELPEGIAVPGRGVYAVRVGLGGLDEPAAGVLNIGVRPTFGGTRETVEVHVLDHQGDLYGRDVTVQFVDRIRDERRFSDVDELIGQISRDIDTARRILGRRKP